MASICCEYDAGGWLVVGTREKRQALACFGSVILFTLAFPHSNRLAKTSPALDADSADLRLPFPNPGQEWNARCVM